MADYNGDKSGFMMATLTCAIISFVDSNIHPRSTLNWSGWTPIKKKFEPIYLSFIWDVVGCLKHSMFNYIK